MYAELRANRAVSLSSSSNHLLAIRVAFFLVCLSFPYSRCAVCNAQTADPISLSSVLDRAREAYGVNKNDAPAFTKLTGSARIRDIALDYSNTWDKEGRFILDLSGPVRMVQAFDGQLSWSINPSRSMETLELGARERSLLTNWMVTGFWLSPDAPVVIQLDPGVTDSEVAALNIKFKDGRFECQAKVRIDSGLLDSFSLKSSGTTQTYRFADYHSYSGTHLAHDMKILENGTVFGTVKLTKVSFPETLDSSKFSPRVEDRRVAQFDSATKASLTVIAGNNKTYVPVVANGSHEGWFLFDTGANGTVISTEFARQAAAKRIGKVDSTGIGGRIEATAMKLGSLKVGPVTIEDVAVIARSDIGGRLAPPGKKLSGILGNDVLKHCVIEYEHQRRFIALYDAKTYKLRRGSWQPLKMSNGSPVVQVKYEGKTGWFLVDTGADAAVLLSPNTVYDQKLLRDRNTRATKTYGSGGSIRSRNGQLKWVEFAGQRFNNVKTIFLTERKGTMADALIDGIVGVGLFGDRKVVFDYQNRRIALIR